VEFVELSELRRILVDEVELDRFWRDRCGEPSPHWPIRCRRDLDHESPHVGAGRDIVVWDGTGNAISAQTDPGLTCWCQQSFQQQRGRVVSEIIHHREIQGTPGE